MISNGHRAPAIWPLRRITVLIRELSTYFGHFRLESSPVT
ncbi:hypothetical protein LF41_1873 [Lysobacter dokdonensis DS-58]|uniref:Uncharacterized protein n=1 Tax=Lysobacter dokdonensis DS-58 TaxID=1300345 RepID=A0A0A2WYC9_9GAMM|nr:hypothetical protein LF41_1873 [Lysobacter dokdonensis DS-58]